MSITVRVPDIDWSKGFERHWNGGDAVVTHAFDANSFLFPQGERFFIRAARKVMEAGGFGHDAKLAEQVRKFVAQESIHTRQHELYNAWLERHGYENLVRDYIDSLDAWSDKHMPPLTNLAAVCAYEHYTAIISYFVLRNPDVLAQADPDMALIWGWHSIEEIEHRSVCFDLYRAAGGGWLRRTAVFVSISLNFAYIFNRLYFSMLYRDGYLRPSRLAAMLSGMLRFFLGTKGVLWYLLFYGLRYMIPGFHPDKLDTSELLSNWLKLNRGRFRSPKDNAHESKGCAE